MERKHDRVRQSVTEIHNRHHVPFVWNKPPLIVQQNKEGHKLFRCSPMAAHLQLLARIWLDSLFSCTPQWSARFKMAVKYMWPPSRTVPSLPCLIYSLPTACNGAYAAKPVIVNSVKYQNECEGEEEDQGLLQIDVNNKVKYDSYLITLRAQQRKTWQRNNRMQWS